MTIRSFYRNTGMHQEIQERIDADFPDVEKGYQRITVQKFLSYTQRYG